MCKCHFSEPRDFFSVAPERNFFLIPTEITQPSVHLKNHAMHVTKESVLSFMPHFLPLLISLTFFLTQPNCGQHPCSLTNIYIVDTRQISAMFSNKSSKGVIWKLKMRQMNMKYIQSNTNHSGVNNIVKNMRKKSSFLEQPTMLCMHHLIF